MKRPHHSDFNLMEDSIKEQKKRRRICKFVMAVMALLVLIANYWFWIWSFSIIGNWSLLGLFLTFWGMIPAAVSHILLDSWLSKRLYDELNRYEHAKKRYDHWFVRTQFAFWDALTGRQFEHQVEKLLNKAGYSAKVTPALGDKGVDILLSDGTIIQCKAHKSCVTPSVARELYGTLQHFKAPRAILISKNGLSRGVYEFIQGKSITLGDVNSLIEMQKKINNYGTESLNVP